MLHCQSRGTLIWLSHCAESAHCRLSAGQEHVTLLTAACPTTGRVSRVTIHTLLHASRGCPSLVLNLQAARTDRTGQKHTCTYKQQPAHYVTFHRMQEETHACRTQVARSCQHTAMIRCVGNCCRAQQCFAGGRMGSVQQELSNITVAPPC
jgi:hypothetical protein